MKKFLLVIIIWSAAIGDTNAQNITLPATNDSLLFSNSIVSSNVGLVIDNGSGDEAYTIQTTLGGVQCREIPSGHFMYITCNSTEIPTSQNDLVIAITYWSASSNNIWFNYNGTGNDYTGGDFPKPGGGQWVTSILPITDAAFKSNMNGGGDFRLGYGSEDNYIKEIKIYKTTGLVMPVFVTTPSL